MKKLFCLLACLFCLGSLYAEINDLTFQNLVPLFPERDNLKEISKQYNLTLKKYEDDEFEFTCDSLKNDYFEILNISYDYSETISTWLKVKTCKYYAYKLLESFFCKDSTSLLLVNYTNHYFGNTNYFDFSFYDNILKIYAAISIPDSDVDINDSIIISLNYDLDNNEEE